MPQSTPEALDEEHFIAKPRYDLRKQPSYVMKKGQEAVKRFNRGKPATERFNLNVVTEPFWGSLIGARVILLNDHPLPCRQMMQDTRLATFEKILKESCLDVLHKLFSANIRAKVDQPFRVIKRQFVYTKLKYRRLAKNTANLVTLFALSNLWMVRKRLLNMGAQG